jgi:hypothetical protein
MKTVPLSLATQEALNALKELYRHGKVFDKNRAVYRDSALEAVISAAIENLGKDTKKFLNIKHDVEIAGDLLFNMRALVTVIVPRAWCKSGVVCALRRV